MTTQQTPASNTAPQKPVVTSALEQLASQTVDKLTTLIGIYATGAVEDYTLSDGKTGKTGFIQILSRARDDSNALKLTRIKVEEDNYPKIDILNKTRSFQLVELKCIVREDMRGKMKIILHKDQPNLAK